VFSLSSKYTYEDLNRVENKLVEIYEKIYEILGYDFIAYPSDTSFPSDYTFPTFATNSVIWEQGDFPFVEEIDRIKTILNELSLLIAYPYNFQDLELEKRFFNFIEANKLEINLLALEKMLQQAVIKFSGTSYSGETIWL
jgi:hypothetical protein